MNQAWTLPAGFRGSRSLRKFYSYDAYGNRTIGSDEHLGHGIPSRIWRRHEHESSDSACGLHHELRLSGYLTTDTFTGEGSPYLRCREPYENRPCQTISGRLTLTMVRRRVKRKRERTETGNLRHGGERLAEIWQPTPRIEVHRKSTAIAMVSCWAAESSSKIPLAGNGFSWAATHEFRSQRFALRPLPA